MKNLKFLFLLFLFPLIGFSQDLSGIWTGVLSNDSSTIRKDQTFEIALTEYRGKVYGYVYSTFIVNDTLYYIIKRVKGDVNGKICEVKDDEVVTHNFQKSPEKGVNVIYTFRQNQQENEWTIDGNWKTNATKEYYSISGDVNAKAEKDLSRSKLYEHLGDLNLQNTLVAENVNDKKSNKKSSKEKPVKEDVVKSKESRTVKKPESDIALQNAKKDLDKEKVVASNKTSSTEIVSSEKIKPEQKETKKDIVKTNDKKPSAKNDIVKTETKNNPSGTELKPKENNSAADISKTGIKNEKAITEIKPVENKQNADITNTDVIKPETKKDVVIAESNSIKNNPVSEKINTEIKKPDSKNDVAITGEKPVTDKAGADLKKSETPTNILKDEQKTAQNKQAEGIPKTDVIKPDPKKDIAIIEQKPEEKNTTSEFVFTDLKRTERKINLATAMVQQRESVPSETIYFKSDSLVLVLYDNGEIDGDTVSVILNGELIIEKQGLKSAAFKKTIYLAPGDSDSILLVLYADNLGIYPPNTGLLIIKDGNESFYVRFKADFERNAAIMLRRKLK